MKKSVKLSTLLFVLLFINCQSNKQKVKTMDSNKVVKKSTTKEVKLFFLKDEISLPSSNHIHFSKENEVVLFRPTESAFGKLLEDTQSDALVELDGNFEELTNAIIDTYKGDNNLRISICEKPLVAIPQVNDTLYFDTTKDKYGILFCKKGQKPIFKVATEQNVVQQIKKEYTL